MRFLRLLRSRRKYLAVAVPAGAVGLAGLAGIAALASSGALSWEGALLLAATGAVGAAAAANALLAVVLVRRVGAVSRKVKDIDRRVDAQGRTVVEAVGADRLEMVTALDSAREELKEIDRRVDANGRKVVETVEADRLETVKTLGSTRNELKRMRARVLPEMSAELSRSVAVQGRNDYEQQVAWAELRDHLGAAAFMPPLRGWAASPDVMRVVVRLVDRHGPDLVVECGSGASSVWLGYALRRAGRGRLVALEHSGYYAERSRRLVRDHGLDDIVEIRDAPLTEWSPDSGADGDADEADRPWYDAAAVADLHDIGLVFVDGPPGSTAEQARYPALPVLIPRCASDAVFVLDDADRPDERAVEERWLEEFPELSVEEEQTEKGARVFTRKAL
ncbi:class I SAM-dependent methyltransferase [Streptomonospora salina]|uniref:Putative O-methyltransferase YrrM n=1 Tax=Streptomonospora salina TaxID=104205 RepID=A0A841E375_9ACTN|nr:class I SAM-dependent methyltransferase [Streptomonospora salina]MBB5996914.1 putative O-methyltransferase YrrM [Streptomonospora salina]